MGTTTGWISWAIESSIGRALFAGGASFGGSLVVVLAAVKFVTDRDT